MTTRRHPLVAQRRYRITHGGSAYPHLVGQNVRVLDGTSFCEVLKGSMKGQKIPTFGLGLRANPEREVCKCCAYEWPHRKGTGRCLSNEFPPFCGECGQPCHANLVEGDSPGTYAVVSSCHEGNCYDDPELKRQIYPEDLREEPHE